jgi:hypothetical protein
MVDMGEGRTTTTVYCSVTHVRGSPTLNQSGLKDRGGGSSVVKAFTVAASPAHAQAIPPLLRLLALPKSIIGNLAMTKILQQSC